MMDEEEEEESFLGLLQGDSVDLSNVNMNIYNMSMEDEYGQLYADNDAEGANLRIPAAIASIMDEGARDVSSTSSQILGLQAASQAYNDDNDAEEPLRGDPSSSSHEQLKSVKKSIASNPYAFEEMDLYASQSKGKGSRRKNLDPSETDRRMGQVSHLYATKDYPNAFKLLHEIIREDHKAAAAWKLLAVLHDELGNPAKALQANFIAAHLDPKDADLWTRLADISMTNGNKPDALYCYTKAVSADPTNVENWYQRSVMYVDQGQIYKAISGFTSILQINPYEMRAIQELSRIYIQLHESNKAVKLFEAALEADARDPLPAVVEEDDDDDDYDDDMGNTTNKGKAPSTELDPKLRRWRVGYAELLNLLELYLDIGEYEQGCVAAEIVVGRIELGILDGSVYGISPELHSNVPLEIRVKYGICKLWLDDHESAKTHFDALLEAEVEHYSDLFIDIIDAYMKKRMFALAVGILEVVVTNDCMNVASVWAKMAHCFQHLGRLDDAADLYKAAIEVEPREYDWQLQLAEIYEALGEMEKANEIVEEVNERTRADAADSTVRAPRRRKGPLATQSATGSIQFQTPRYEKPMTYPFDEEGEESDDDEGFNENGDGGEQAEALPGFLKTIKSDKTAREDKAVLLAAERLAIAENREWYGKLLILGDKLVEPVKRADFVRFARKLVIRFQNERQFYPAERSKLYAPRGYRGAEDRFTVYLGLTFATWFEVFVKYAMALTMDKKDEDAYLALKAALDANVFFHNETLKLQLRMYMIASALICENFGRVVELAKAFCTNRPLENDMYRLYCAVLNGGGPDAVSAFASNICQKQFARTVKTFEAHLAKNPNSEIHKSPILMCLCGHILMCARSYWGAIRLYLDAYKMAPKDPLINLSLGLAYLHAAMQRRVDDRHKRVLQAFAFLYQYEELRNHSPEALYNVGRAFHQIGLNHIAIEYYEKVLAADDGNESLWPIREAAYNMSMILVASGSNAYAQAILQKHLHF
ncbi:hypothetical protein BJ741DRAFT_593510 [Chytriomyces cf. hyalinus JEL632]|nr:hypothetical protein BJ741DRAFT_593510 [Chytriomyces cf. hyalinus JEL632]